VRLLGLANCRVCLLNEAGIATPRQRVLELFGVLGWDDPPAQTIDEIAAHPTRGEQHSERGGAEGNG
jgi:hypothetical protein